MASMKPTCITCSQRGKCKTPATPALFIKKHNWHTPHFTFTIHHLALLQLLHTAEPPCLYNSLFSFSEFTESHLSAVLFQAVLYHCGCACMWWIRSVFHILYITYNLYIVYIMMLEKVCVHVLNGVQLLRAAAHLFRSLLSHSLAAIDSKSFTNHTTLSITQHSLALIDSKSHHTTVVQSNKNSAKLIVFSDHYPK